MRTNYQNDQKKRKEQVILDGVMKQIGKEFREVRQLLCLTKEHVADATYLSEKTIARLENGENFSMVTYFLIVGFYLEYAESKQTISQFMTLFFKSLGKRER